MTPGARVAAAIDVIGIIQDGTPAEQALTRWGRTNRYAGSKDRAAVRDHVYDVLRSKRSVAALGGGDTGRGMMIGLLRQSGIDPATLFTGEGHAPAPLTDAERQQPDRGDDLDAREAAAVRWNLPDWLVQPFIDSLGVQGAEQAALQLQHRAPITLRVNLGKSDVAAARQALAAAGIDTKVNPLSSTALSVVAGERKLRNSAAFMDGLVELQDAASQAVVELHPRGDRVLDYCAGGGGKSLALAAQGRGYVAAHDIDARRMRDLPGRSARAGCTVDQLETDALPEAGPFDVVLCDAPCSGSGSWRRAPDGKWNLTAARLAELAGIQDDILDKASRLVAPGGTLAYATCSILAVENQARIDAFVAAHPRWKSTLVRHFDVTADGDGFFTAHLTRAQ